MCVFNKIPHLLSFYIPGVDSGAEVGGGEEEAGRAEAAVRAGAGAAGQQAACVKEQQQQVGDIYMRVLCVYFVAQWFLTLLEVLNLTSSIHARSGWLRS